MRFIINDFDIYYEKHGNGKSSIIILPGWGETRKTFDKMISFLKTYFTVYIIDYPGFGNSTFPNRNLSIEDYALLIKDFINVKCIENPILIAHSFGGRIAILLSGKYKVQLKKIIMMDVAGIKPKTSMMKYIKQKIYKFLKKIANIFPKKFKIKYLEKLIKIFGSSDYKNLSPNIRKTFINIVNKDLTEYIEKINCDTLLIWGEKDMDTPINDAYKINKLIENSGLITIKEGSHFSYLEYPQYTNKIVFEFLKVFATK